MLFNSRRWGLALLTLLVLALTACQQQLIPNTDVEDSEQNRGILEYCEKYRAAVEEQNIGALLEMADETYYEDGGNIDSSDDLDRAGLEEYLRGKFRNTKAIRYEVRYRAISYGREGEVFVDYTYSASFKLVTPKGEQWRRSVADNRLELVRKDDGFRIIAGM